MVAATVLFVEKIQFETMTMSHTREEARALQTALTWSCDDTRGSETARMICDSWERYLGELVPLCVVNVRHACLTQVSTLHTRVHASCFRTRRTSS